MKARDLMSGVFWLVVAIYFSIEALRLDIGTLGKPGPSLVILFGSGILGVFSIVLICEALLRWRRSVPGTEIADAPKAQGQFKVVLALCALCTYIVLLPKVGFIIATFGLMTFLFRMLGQASLWLQGAIGFITVALAYFIFSVCLDVHLPKGPFGF